MIYAKYLTIVFLLIGFLPYANAQVQQVNGKVTAEDGTALPGVNVMIKGTTTGTITDVEGNYTLGVPEPQSVLIFSSIGFTTREVPVTGRSEINLTMTEDVKRLNEVVVTALGISQQSIALPYATQNIAPKELTEVRAPNNFLNSFQGKIANALITQNSGGVGSDASIILRGNRSIAGSSDALIVVDGIPVNDPSNINPDDIASVTVLRGASAGVLYGSQAGNGVIVITTKKGTADEISVNINSGVVFESPFSLPDVQDTYGQGSAMQLDPTSVQSWGARMEGQSYTNHLGEESVYTPQPDNIKDFFHNGVSTNNTISVAGGTEKAQGYLSYMHNNVSGIIPNNTLTSHNVNLRLTNKISDKLSTDAKVTYFTEDIDNVPRTSEGNTTILDIYNIPRNVRTREAEQYQYLSDLGIPTPTAWPVTRPYGNPYWLVNNDIHDKTSNQVVGLLSAKYQLTDWLSVTGRATLDRVFEKRERKVYQGTMLWATRPGGYYSQVNVTSTQKWFDVIFEGNNSITQDLKIGYHAGAIYKDNRFDQTSAVADGLNVANKFSLNFAIDPSTSSSGTQVQTQSVFGQVNLSYKEALYVNASLRNDWDSRLPAPHSFSYYSAGVSGLLSEMITLPDYLPFLKASVNYAEVGNGGQFGLLSTTYSYVKGAGHGYLKRSSVLPFPELKPAIVKNLEIGLEAGLFKNRLGFTVTYYKSNSVNQLLTISLPEGTGYASRYINAGNIQNQGVELVLEGNPVKSASFNWDLSFNLAFNRNKVVELSDNLKEVFLRGFFDFGGAPAIKEGGSYGDLYGYQWKRDQNGNFLVNSSGVPLTTRVTNDEPGYLGNFNPRATLGLTNTFRYKGISLRVLINGRIGGELVNGTEQNLSFSGLTEGTLPHREGGWDLGGVDTEGQRVTETITAQEFWQTASGKRFGVGEFFTYDATNFRVREVALGYNIPISSNFIKSAQLSAVARNLLWLYRGSSVLDIPGVEKRKLSFDPDMSNRGIVYGQFPSTRSVGFNLKLSF